MYEGVNRAKRTTEGGGVSSNTGHFRIVTISLADFFVFLPVALTFFSRRRSALPAADPRVDRPTGTNALRCPGNAGEAAFSVVLLKHFS